MTARQRWGACEQFQATRLLPGQRWARERDPLVQFSDLAAEEVDVPQTACDGLCLLLRQLLLDQPHAALLPEESLTGGRPIRHLASTACTSFFTRVRARTSPARRATRRRNELVASSGTHTALSIPADSNLASIAASNRSDFTRACEIARVSAALHTTTCSTSLSSRSRAIIIAPQLASNTTWSLPFRPAANSRIASGVLAIRPTRETRPPSATATSQKSR
jgi:hypothetical protein